MCQFEVAVGDRSVYLDLAWPDCLILAIECDSLAYHFGRQRLQWDDSCQNRLVLLGWTVLRFTWRDLVDHPGLVIAQVRAALARSQANLRKFLAPDARRVREFGGVQRERTTTVPAAWSWMPRRSSLGTAISSTTR